MLLVDGGMLAELEIQDDWRTTALQSMRGQEIKIISR